ncbi:MAG TPA: MFS transporter, partial [Firmicutes bacterium]|nr:MFS transporter [Bacillota bacterium]
MQNEKTGFRKFLGLTFLIGFGFFTMGLMDPLYDTYVPIFLGKYIDQNKTIGAIMTLDNIFALFLIPIVSAWSDNMRTRIGRRMPFIIITLPLTAICFSYLPYAAAISLSALIVTVFFLNVFKQSARGPVVALMPDTIPGEYRSEANGVINTMGGIAAIIGTIGLARLMDVDIILPLLGATKDRLPFPVAGLLVILATILVFVFVREKNRESAAREERVPFVKS